MNPAIRSAESDRLSSCSFADRVAHLTIETFQRHCPADLVYHQTCIASILVHSPLQGLRVISIGVGTKVLSSHLVLEERTRSLSGRGGDGDCRIRDCHAEILARRGLMRFFYHELTNNTSSSLYFQREATTGRLQCRKGVTFHLYTSSQPCGNATIKRWGKAKKPLQYPKLSVDQFPVVGREAHGHTRLHVTAREQGQIALLVKKDGRVMVTSQSHTEMSGGSANVRSMFVPPPPGMAYPPSTNDPNVHTIINSNPMTLEEVTSDSCSRHSGIIMSCSDKIATWNVLGLQGSLLSIFYVPLMLSTITVGRKFSEIHASRALCCRLQDFCYPLVGISNVHVREGSGQSEMDGLGMTQTDTFVDPDTSQVQYVAHHPVMLSTVVKFDHGVIVTANATMVKEKKKPQESKEKEEGREGQEECGVEEEEFVGARFDEPRCFVVYVDDTVNVFDHDDVTKDDNNGSSLLLAGSVLHSPSGYVLTSSRMTHDGFGSSSEVISTLSSHAMLHSFRQALAHALHLLPQQPPSLLLSKQSQCGQSSSLPSTITHHRWFVVHYDSVMDRILMLPCLTSDSGNTNASNGCIDVVFTIPSAAVDLQSTGSGDINAAVCNDAVTAVGDVKVTASVIQCIISALTYVMCKTSVTLVSIHLPTSSTPSSSPPPLRSNDDDQISTRALVLTVDAYLSCLHRIQTKTRSQIQSHDASQETNTMLTLDTLHMLHSILQQRSKHVSAAASSSSSSSSSSSPSSSPPPPPVTAAVAVAAATSSLHSSFKSLLLSSNVLNSYSKAKQELRTNPRHGFTQWIQKHNLLSLIRHDDEDVQ